MSPSVNSTAQTMNRVRCGQTGDRPGLEWPRLTVARHTIEVGEARRQLLVAAPTGAPIAILVTMHGSTSTPEAQVRLSRMAPLAEQGAVVAFPQGSISSRAGWEWDLHGDVAFLDTAVDYLRETFGATAAPLCVSGMSGGARMASRFASSGRNPVRVLGAVAGLRMPAVEQLDHPVRVVAFHGTRDGFNPYGGGPTARWSESVLDAASAWARANGHSPEPERTEFTSSVTQLSYGPPGDPGAVTLWVCDGAGHTWPGTRLTLGVRLLLGKVSYDVDATAEIWRALGAA
jgi:polyhydroxybutyrate depolymerase